MTNDELAARIVRAMTARGYVVDKGQGEVNVVYVEGMNEDGTPNGNRPEHYDDRRIVIAFKDGKPAIVGNWRATTQPGPKLTQNPVAGARPLGAAIIALGQQRCWTVDLHSGKYEALCQRAGTVVVFRDKNKNYLRDDQTTTGMYGINQHHGSNSASIGGNSAGCLVTPLVKDHQEFMRIVKSDPRYKAKPGRAGFVFATTVIPAAWVLQESAAPLPTSTKVGIGAGIVAAFAALGTFFYQNSGIATVIVIGVLAAVGIAIAASMRKE